MGSSNSIARRYAVAFSELNEVLGRGDVEISQTEKLERNKALVAVEREILRSVTSSEEKYRSLKREIEREMRAVLRPIRRGMAVELPPSVSDLLLEIDKRFLELLQQERVSR